MSLLLACLPIVALAGLSPTATLNNGVVMPLVGAGTWQYNSSTAFDSVQTAIKLGYTHIDTANDYNNQDGVGKALKAYDRSSFFLTSKIPGCGTSGVRMNHCYDDTKAKFEENLKLLDFPYVDLMLLHYPPVLGCRLGCGMIQNQWKAMEEMYKAGKAKAIGVSNYCESCFSCLNKTATVVPQVNQVKYHIGMGADPIALLSYCKAHNILIQAYSPLGDGSSELIHGNLTGSIGARYNKSSVQIALKWIVQKELGVLTKSVHEKYLAQDIDLFDFNLTEDDMATLDKQTTPSGRPSFICVS